MDKVIDKTQMAIHFHSGYRENIKIAWFFLVLFCLLMFGLGVCGVWVALSKEQGYLSLFLIACSVILFVVSIVVLRIVYKIFANINANVPFIVITAQGLEIRPLFNLNVRNIKWSDIEDIKQKDNGPIEITLKNATKGFWRYKVNKISLLDISEFLPEDLFKILLSAKDGFAQTITKDEIAVCMDNLAYSRLNKWYNVGLLLITVLLIVLLFVFDVLLSVEKDWLHWLFIGFLSLVFILRLISLRFDKKAPRNLTLTQTQLKIGVIVARNLRHRRVGEIVLAKEKINGMEFIPDGIIIKIINEEPMVINNLILQDKDKEILRKAFT